MDLRQYVERYRRVRAWTERLCEPLETEDYVVQTMPDVSPAKWHLAHTTWFFETFVVRPLDASYEPLDPRYDYLFNSYYNAVGEPYPRPRRGLLSRPTVREVYAYREHVDSAMEKLVVGGDPAGLEERALVLEVGLQHEQQHQELILTDLKHVLAENPLAPAYRSDLERPGGDAGPMRWIPFSGGDVEIGTDRPEFAFDNERPRHRVHLEPFELADRPVTCGEYRDFMEDGGYQRPELWLSDGWYERGEGGWEAPLYWRRPGGDGGAVGWRIMTLAGLREIDPEEPVCHVSAYEADAFARWCGARLPREEEWEAAAEPLPVEGNFRDAGILHPRPRGGAEAGLSQVYGDVWEWTTSAYSPYPGYAPFSGELGEYNGKFMVNQLVLRGGSAATPAGHVRPTYRNFFPAGARWQFSGIRLAR